MKKKTQKASKSAQVKKSKKSKSKEPQQRFSTPTHPGETPDQQIARELREKVDRERAA